MSKYMKLEVYDFMQYMKLEVYDFMQSSQV